MRILGGAAGLDRDKEQLLDSQFSKE